MINKIILLILFAIACGKECGKRGPSKHPNVYIVGGYDTERWEYPWQTVIGGWCGGSLINDQWILTAGHCANEQTFNKSTSEGREWAIMLGSYNVSMYNFSNYPFIDTEDGSFLVSVEKAIRHPKFDAHKDRPGGGNPRYDLTLIKMKDKLDFNGKHSQLTPICLPNRGVTEEELLQSYCTVSGWGYRNAAFEYNLLQATSVPILSNDFCLKTYPEDFNATDMICGGHLDGGHGSCYGDSGGPLQCRLSDGKWYLIGVVSWGGDKCAVEGEPEVYGNVVNLIDWVVNTIGDN